MAGRSGSLPSMGMFMTLSAEGDQVWLRIVSEAASWADVVDLEVSRAAAVLAAPAIALQHLLA